MTRVFALFDSDDKVQDAQDALEQAGLTDAVERVIDTSVADTGAPRPIGAGAVAPLVHDGRPDGVIPVAVGSNWLSEFGVDDEEARFLADSVNGGASLIVVNSERPDEVETIFNQAGGSRVFRKE